MNVMILLLWFLHARIDNRHADNDDNNIFRGLRHDFQIFFSDQLKSAGKTKQ